MTHIFTDLDTIERRRADRRKSAEQIASRIAVINIAMFAAGFILAAYIFTK